MSFSRYTDTVFAISKKTAIILARNTVWSLLNWKLGISTVQAITEPTIVAFTIHHFGMVALDLWMGVYIVPFELAVMLALVPVAGWLRTSELITLACVAGRVGRVHLAAVSSVAGGLAVVVLVAVTGRTARAAEANGNV